MVLVAYLVEIVIQYDFCHEYVHRQYFVQKIFYTHSSNRDLEIFKNKMIFVIEVIYLLKMAWPDYRA